MAATVAPDGDRDACRWIALRTRPRQVRIVATLVREDGRLHHAHREAFRLQRECRLIATELDHQPEPNSPTAPPRAQESPVPLTVTITPEPSGSVVARGGDSLAQSLLTHAGFPFTSDWYGPRHRLPSSMSSLFGPSVTTTEPRPIDGLVVGNACPGSGLVAAAQLRGLGAPATTGADEAFLRASA
ncbi:hypothetical protein [Streptomyces liangshanensis]|uniref:Uncharacterized protein n=1 Tax=Streptomyces liangshanensis TaxID=2717324 RepID=A0A6G9GTL8_9ACTN|nr:hypothetical protein [Streptomyces liangshanensis]QIQ01287.1 hypothetical protein HA039_02325 [Streptomyces liangshanensis]